MAGSVTFILSEPVIDLGKVPKKDRKKIKSQNKERANIETPICLIFRFGQERIKLSTGEKIKPKYWNQADHKARITKEYDGRNLNARLEGIKTDIMIIALDHLTENANILRKLKEEEKVTGNKDYNPEEFQGIIIDKLTEDFRTILKPGSIKKKHTFWSAIQECIDNSNNKPATITTYKTTKNLLEEYKNVKKIELSFKDINLDFYGQFMNYMLTVRKFAPNTLGKYIKTIKVFMNYGLEKKYTANRDHLKKKFHKPEETADSIYLTDDDLLVLYNLNLSENKKLDRVRDLFLIGCYTGLRFSDLSQLSQDKFIKVKGELQLKVKTIKTGETVNIPLHPTVLEILKKYNGGTPRPISNQKMNVYLKELCNIEHFRGKVVLNKTKGGLSFEQKKEKWELVTVHTARRSFATNTYLAGISPIKIMKITGHKTEKMFMKYIKISQEENADILSHHPYFTKSPLKIAK